MMKVIFFNAYFEPEIAASLYLYSNIAEDLVANGHQVVVIAPTPTRGVPAEVRKEYLLHRRSESMYAGNFRVVRVPLPREAKHPVLRAVRYLLMEGLFLAAGLFARYDVAFLYSTPPTQGALAALLRILRRKPVLYNIQDLFPESLGSTGLARPRSLSWRIGASMQRLTYRHVDKVMTISQSLKQQIAASGMSPDRIEVVPNWVDHHDVFPVPREANALVTKYNLDPAKLYVTYCGNIGHSQNLELLAQVAEQMAAIPSIEFVVVGDGAARSHLVDRTKTLENFRVLPFQPYELIAHVFSLGDIGLIISKRDVGSNSVPSKAWSIMAASRPIVSSFDTQSELTKTIREADCGISTPADDKQALLLAIEQLASSREKRESLGLNGHRYVLDNLARGPSTKRVIAILEGLVQADAQAHDSNNPGHSAAGTSSSKENRFV